MCAAVQISTSVNLRVISTLILMLLASAAVFSVLARRWTTQRRRVSLEDWARAAKLKFSEGGADRIPAILERLKPTAESVMLLEGKGLQIIRIASSAVATAGQQGPPPVWKLLLADLRQPWGASGMRPERATQSLLDLYSLSSFPLLGGTERFVVYAVDSNAAQELPQSTIRSLLPSDLGLLLLGPTLIIDFSGRAFDELEFSRLIPLAKQLAEHIQ